MADEPPTDGAENAQTPGGQGVSAPAPAADVQKLLPSPHHERRDLRMLERAVRQQWAIDDRAFSQLPNAMLLIALDRERDDRSRIAAARVITTMHGQNRDDAKPAAPNELHLHQHAGNQTLVVNNLSGLTDEQLRQFDSLCDALGAPAGDRPAADPAAERPAGGPAPDQA